MENFFSLLKQEMSYGEAFYSFEELKAEIEIWSHEDNYTRIKIKLNGLSPVNERLAKTV